MYVFIYLHLYTYLSTYLCTYHPPFNLGVCRCLMCIIFTEWLAVVQALVQYLPEGQQDMEGLIENIHSPQLQQAISSLSEALNSNSFNAIMANLGLDPSPGVAALVRDLFPLDTYLCRCCCIV